MERLTQKDQQGNWCLRGVRWEQLHIGQPVTGEIHEKLYGALCKLMEYEDTGLSPERVEELNDFESSQCGHLLTELGKEREKHKWIPVEKELPPCGENVHVTVRRGYVEAGYYDDIRQEWWTADDEGLLDVIAWQPVPEPYRPDNENFLEELQRKGNI